jgi:ribosomal protein S18 acetylase RimI-like enzyme
VASAAVSERNMERPEQIVFRAFCCLVIFKEDNRKIRTSGLRRYSSRMLGSRLEVKVRKGIPADAKGIADVFQHSWLQAYRGIIPHQHLQNMIKRRGAEWWKTAIRSGDSVLVLEHADSIAGYATLGVSRTRGPCQGEIYELYMAPSYQGLGFGEHLFEACRAGLDQKRLRGLIIWALVENVMATSFYWNRGGRPIAQTIEKIGGAKFEKVAYGWN